jgi:hypothetical protein
MGGRGSGRSGRPSYESAASLVLCTTTFARAGLRFGVRGSATLTFTSDGESFPVAIEIDTTVREVPYMQLAHARRTDPPVAQHYNVRLLTSPQWFGGLRWWFQCPRTGRRAVKLFLPLGGHQFWSRHAYGLGYASQREDRMGCAQLQAEKIYRQLGGEGHWMDDPPPKPKWMRWRTYDRLAAKLDTYNARFDSAWASGVMRRYG